MNEFLTICEASELLRVKISTIYGWVHQRRIPFRKHGSRIVFAKSDLESWSKSKEVSELAIGRCTNQTIYANQGNQPKSAESSLKTEQKAMEATTPKKGARRGYK